MGPKLAPAIERIRRRAGRAPRAVAADRGYGQPAFERDLHEMGVRTVAIPRQGTTSATRKKPELAQISAHVAWGGSCRCPEPWVLSGGWRRYLSMDAGGGALAGVCPARQP